MKNYKLFEGEHGIESINIVGTNISIPLAPDNTDYQEYLEWVAEGNTPEPAE